MKERLEDVLGYADAVKELGLIWYFIKLTKDEHKKVDYEIYWEAYTEAAIKAIKYGERLGKDMTSTKRIVMRNLQMYAARESA